VQHIAESADEAMARYAGGDDAAFVAVYNAVTPRVRRFLDRHVRDRARVPDLVQETLLHVHRARRTFAPGAKVLPWVLAIARHQLIDSIRCAPRETPVDVGDTRSLAAHPFFTCTAGTGEDFVAAKETAERLRFAFTRLPGPQRAALELVKGQGLSPAEAATRLGTTVTGVKLRAHRAYRTLRAELGAAA
jgi:RNA polymerase sigma-70 factor (ECF subfamily)